jgi:hypothetical protein
VPLSLRRYYPDQVRTVEDAPVFLSAWLAQAPAAKFSKVHYFDRFYNSSFLIGSQVRNVITQINADDRR